MCKQKTVYVWQTELYEIEMFSYLTVCKKMIDL